MNTHRIRVTKSSEDDFEYELIHPGGDACECWMECQGVHLVYEDWELEEEVAHGEYHRMIGSYLCVEVPGCWLDTRDIEFDARTYPVGLYDFIYDRHDADVDELNLFVKTMTPVEVDS